MFDYEVCHICGDNDQEANILGDGRFAICDSCDNTNHGGKMKAKEVTILFTGSMTVSTEFLDIYEGQILDLGDAVNNAERVSFNGEIHAVDGVTLPPESVEYRID